MLNILATGTLVSVPKPRQNATGKTYTTASMRVPTEDGETVLVSARRLQWRRRGLDPGVIQGRFPISYRTREAHRMGRAGRRREEGLVRGDRPGVDRLPDREKKAAGRAGTFC